MVGVQNIHYLSVLEIAASEMFPPLRYAIIGAIDANNSHASHTRCLQLPKLVWISLQLPYGPSPNASVNVAQVEPQIDWLG